MVDAIITAVKDSVQEERRFITVHSAGHRVKLIPGKMMAGYPPAIIRKRDRLAYIGALEKAQLGGSKSDYENIILKAADRSLDIYLKAAKGESAMADVDTDQLLKIGELAKASGETVPTICYWTKQGLLEVAEVTESGYQLYAADMVQRCGQIQKLKGERRTLEEIQQLLS